MIDWIIPKDVPNELLLKRADNCGVEPLVQDLIGFQDDEALLEQAAHVAVYWATLRIALKAITPFPCIVLKGAPLALRLYDDELMRSSTDVDLWIDKCNLDDAILALQQWGFSPQPVVRPWATNQVLLTHNGALLPVELHWALTQPPYKAPSFEQAWETSLTEFQHELCIHTLSDEFTWIHLLLHAQQHVFALKPWCDLDAAKELIKAPRSTLKKYGLLRIDRLVRGILNDSPNAYPVAKFVREYLASVLKNDHRGELVPHVNSTTNTAVTIASRALTMLLLDGLLYPSQAIAFHLPLACSILAARTKRFFN